MKITNFLLLGFFFSAPFITGCAFGTRHAVLTYPPPQKPGALTNAVPAVALGKVSVGQFSDDRANKILLGYVRNGYGMKTAEVRLDSDVTTVIADAVRHELAQAGWEIVNSETAKDLKLPVISGEVLVLHCDAYLSYEGEATILIHAMRDGRETFKKTYAGKGGGGMNWAMTGESYGKAVSQAIQDALLNFVRDMPTIVRQE